jgi:TPR repeat protein
MKRLAPLFALVLTVPLLATSPLPAAAQTGDETADAIWRKASTLELSDIRKAWRHFDAGAKLAAGKRRAQAIVEFRQGLAIQPADVRIQTLVAELLEAEGRPQEAIEHWKAVRAIAEDDADHLAAREAIARLTRDPKALAFTALEAQRLRERSEAEGQVSALLRRAADEGQPIAQLQLGQLYESGHSLTKDTREAAAWYRKAAAGGNSEAKAALDRMELQRVAEARRAKEAQEEAQRLAEAARRRAEAEKAQMALARLISLFNQAKAGDASRFLELRELAQGGDAEAQNFIGACYLHGYGTEKDEVEATRWWVRSARKGNANAAKNLDMLRRGGYLVEIIERSTK